ncbi:hypothetical protein NMY22_g16168 [Coprinellus aureogranulatus]|nr:hypothetical protein NMY22_g16168 [Coprinellus aureogranulatus]
MLNIWLCSSFHHDHTMSIDDLAPGEVKSRDGVEITSSANDARLFATRAADNDCHGTSSTSDSESSKGKFYMASWARSVFPLAYLAPQTCRALRRVCGTRQLWKHLFLESLGTTIPTPFFLSKPLAENSAEDLELALRRWQTVKTPSNPVQHIQRDVQTEVQAGRQFLEYTAIMTPGGRWVLAGYSDGSVWYFDVSDDWTSTSPIAPRLLVPGFTSEAVPPGGAVKMELAADWTSVEALGSSAASHCLTQFNLAVVVSMNHEPPDTNDKPMHVNVWRVTVCEDAGETSLKLDEQLSAFKEEPNDSISSFSLHGRMLAYTWSIEPRPIPYVVVVDWRDVNGKTPQEGLVRRCFRIPQEAQSVHLVPGNRITVVHDTSRLSLYHWESCCTPSSVNLRNAPRRPSRSPTWTLDTRGWITYRAIQPSFTISNTIRVIFPTRHVVYRLSIPIDDYSEEAVQVEAVLRGEFSSTQETQIFHFSRAVGLAFEDGYKRLFYAQYPWPGAEPDETVTRSKQNSVDYLVHDMEMNLPGSVLFDQFTNRVVVVDEDAARFFTVLTEDPKPASTATLPLDGCPPVTEPQDGVAQDKEHENPRAKPATDGDKEHKNKEGDEVGGSENPEKEESPGIIGDASQKSEGGNEGVLSGVTSAAASLSRIIEQVHSVDTSDGENRGYTLTDDASRDAYDGVTSTVFIPSGEKSKGGQIEAIAPLNLTGGQAEVTSPTPSGDAFSGTVFDGPSRAPHEVDEPDATQVEECRAGEGEVKHSPGEDQGDSAATTAEGLEKDEHSERDDSTTGSEPVSPV